MGNDKLNYLDHLELLTVLISHVGTRPCDDATAEELAEHLGFSLEETVRVLDGFKAIFHRSRDRQPSSGHPGKYYRYSLLRRYARRIYKHGDLKEPSKPLSDDEISALLNYVESRVKVEVEDRRHRIQLGVTMVAAIVAALASLISPLMK